MKPQNSGEFPINTLENYKREQNSKIPLKDFSNEAWYLEWVKLAKEDRKKFG